ncbi:MAG: hypothetical protein WCV58_03870 [Patescibacteria group bacterium]
MNATVDIATRFVDLALKYKRWDEVKELPTDEIQVLFEIVCAAGFEPKEVALGKLVGHYLYQDGSKTGETYPINDLCSYKVVNQEGESDFFATGWLDRTFRRVAFGVARNGEDRNKLINTISVEIERSIPLEPIQLTPDEDFLCEILPSGYAIDHTRDDDRLGCTAGVHKYCNSWMDRIRATKTHDAIVCRKCHLRVLFPKEVETYGELRQALAAKFSTV